MAQSAEVPPGPVPILAQTPTLDGTISAGEWQRLYELPSVTAFAQWEPGVLYLATQMPEDQALVLSLDLKGDGWLVGRDNVEIKMAWRGGQRETTMRFLDATDRSGPRWIAESVPEGLLRVAESTSDARRSIEMKLLGLGFEPFAQGMRVGIRLEPQPVDAVEVMAFMPRSTTLTLLALDAGENLPEGVTWNSEYRARSVALGDTIRIRLNFRLGEGVSFDRSEARVAGSDGERMAKVAQPFPGPDRRRRSILDYTTEVPRDLAPGFRVLDVLLRRENGSESKVRTSFLVARLVVFEPSFPSDLTASDQPQVVRGSIVVRSQSLNRLSGSFTISPAPQWTVSRGDERRFLIYQSRGSARIPVELIAPAGASGLVPLRLRAQIGEEVVEQEIFLRLAPKATSE